MIACGKIHRSAGLTVSCRGCRETLDAQSLLGLRFWLQALGWRKIAGRWHCRECCLNLFPRQTPTSRRAA